MSKEYSIYAVRKNREDKAFAKEVLDVLVNEETPADIFDIGVFKPVENGFGSVFVADGSVNTSYTAKAGTDRKEEYYEIDREGRRVKKTRTVTDWTPIAGNHMYSGYGACITADDPDKYSFNMSIVSDCEPYQENLDFETTEPFDVNSEIYKMAENSLIASAESDMRSDIRNSYDHVENIRCSSSANVDAYEQYMIPTQQIKFEYNSKEYCFAAFARDGAYISRKFPSVSKGIDDQVKEMMNYKLTRPLVINLIILVIAGIIMFAVSKTTTNDGPGVIIELVTIALMIIYAVLFNKKYQENRNNIVSALKAKKRQTVNKVLAKYN